MHPFDHRRRQALQRFAGGVAIIPAARVAIRSNDTEYPFHQDPDFRYLTGFEEPDAVLVLAPEHPHHRSVLFLRPRDREAELWTGPRLGVEAAPSVLGVDAAYPIAELDERLAHLLVGADVLYAALGRDDAFDRRVLGALDRARALTRRKGRAPRRIADPGLVLHEMRLRKSAEELAAIRTAARITVGAHLAAMRATMPGIHEYELQAILECEYRRHGAVPSYEPIVAGGERATILHYVRNDRRIADGELVLVDSGCAYDGYAADVTRTWPANGRFTAEQRALYEIVVRAFDAAAACVRPATPQRAMHDAAARMIAEGLRDLGLLRGSLDEIMERESYRAYFPHGTGHWLGLDVHDVGAYRDEDDRPRLFEPGMVTTVEPGIYVPRDADCPDAFKGIGIRIEDDILVTASGHENLSAALPKHPDEIEALVGDREAAPCVF